MNSDHSYRNTPNVKPPCRQRAGCNDPYEKRIHSPSDAEFYRRELNFQITDYLESPSFKTKILKIICSANQYASFARVGAFLPIGPKKRMLFAIRGLIFPFILYFCSLNTDTKTKYHDTGGVV